MENLNVIKLIYWKIVLLIHSNQGENTLVSKVD